MTILDQLAGCARERTVQAKLRISLEELKQQALSLPKGNFTFEKAIKKPGLSFICECKKASPSKGIIAQEFPYLQIAKDYEVAGADCISVLTEPKWFLGSDEYLKKIISMGPELAMASRGAKGCILYDGEKFFAQAAAPLAEVKDTLGAGDSLIASFLTGYIGKTKAGVDRETAIRESLAEAAAFAAGICGMEGAFGYGKKYE